MDKISNFPKFLEDPSLSVLMDLITNPIIVFDFHTKQACFVNQAFQELFPITTKKKIDYTQFWDFFSTTETELLPFDLMIQNLPLPIETTLNQIPFLVKATVNQQQEILMFTLLNNSQTKELERFHQIINAIDEIAQKKKGESYLKTIVRLLNQSLQAHYTYVAEISPDKTMAHTLYWYDKNGLLENVSYNLADTPCKDVNRDGICVYTQNVQAAFPNDQFLKEKNIVGYIGVPIRDESEYETDLILVATFQNPISQPDEKIKLLNIFSQRIRSELDQLNLFKSLTQQAHANKKLKATEKDLLKILSEKQTLLKEIHHRVKNNMQVITSLLSLQASYLEDQQLKAIFHNSQHRINSMAVVHEMLYQNNEISSVNYQEYLQRLIKGLVHSMKQEHDQIQLDISAQDIRLNIETAIPLGLMINEIITNSLKYAFQEHTAGKIFVKIVALDDTNYKMEIGDNGIGFNHKEKPPKSTSLGLKLIKKLATQLMGTIVRDISKEGAYYIVHFKNIQP